MKNIQTKGLNLNNGVYYCVEKHSAKPHSGAYRDKLYKNRNFGFCKICAAKAFKPTG